MKIHFSYHNSVNDSQKRILEGYADDKKLSSLTALLQHGNFDLADLNIRVEYLPHHNNFLLKANLKIAKRVLFAEETGYKLMELFDLVLGHLVAQIRKLESLRHDT
ncbi:MAG: hypothetical protein Q7K28_01605 [Candidatus Wildermuthbacteria bacterium]|nr:hypothetical protein [Candidatus Wildermuthbacteria bacterium]